MGGAPSRIVLFNGQSAELGRVAVSSPVPFDLELQVSYFVWGGYSISYRTGSSGDQFCLRLKDGGPHDTVLLDGADWTGGVAGTGEWLEIGPLPGGTHRVECFSGMTSVEYWRAHVSE